MRNLLAKISLITITAIIIPVISQAATLNKISATDVAAVVPDLKPTITSLNPSTATNSGSIASWIVTGTNFTDATLVKLEGGPQYFLLTVNSDTQITVNNPDFSGATPGVYNVQVTTPNGTNTTSSAKMTIDSPAPTANAQIVNLTPISFSIFPSTNRNIEFDIIDNSGGDTLAWLATAASGSTNPGSGSAVGTGVSATFQYTSPGVTGSDTIVINADDDGNAGDGHDDQKTIPVTILPLW